MIEIWIAQASTSFIMCFRDSGAVPSLNSEDQLWPNEKSPINFLDVPRLQTATNEPMTVQKILFSSLRLEPYKYIRTSVHAIPLVFKILLSITYPHCRITKLFP